MLSFETLLVKELQKQQSRAEFCDIVLQTQGVSVPVHSCVLSAFSPWLCGSLSAMPPRNGQKRLIEVPAMEACTLLGLVSLIYSGQLSQDKEEVLSAACKLGINITQEEAKKPNEKSTKVAEKECQTEYCVESLWRRNKGLGSFTDNSEISLTTPSNASGDPNTLPSIQIMDVVSRSTMFPSVGGDISQVYICPPGTTYQTSTCTPLPSFSQTICAEPLTNEGETGVDVSVGDEFVMETISRFENNIPGFINYFVDANILQGESGDGEVQGEPKVQRRRSPLREAGRFHLEGERSNASRKQSIKNRCGRVAWLACMGQGGGMVGRLTNTKQDFKKLDTRRRQVRLMMTKKTGWKERSSGKRPRQKRGRARGKMGVQQEKAPKRRGRPRKEPYPKISRASHTNKSPKPSAPSMMHTAALPPASQNGLSQPIDRLIDDVIAQLPLMPNNDPSSSKVSIDNNSDSTRPHSSAKQPEGELTEMLDSFLRTFDQHVEDCDSDFQAGMMPTVNDQTQVCGELNEASVSSPSDTQRLSITQNRFRAGQRPQKPSSYWPLKVAGQQEEEIPTMLTRSQRHKRKLPMMEDLPRNDRGPRKYKKAQPGLEKDDGKLPVDNKEVHMNKKLSSNSLDTNTLRKVMNTARPNTEKTLVKPPEMLNPSEAQASNLENQVCQRMIEDNSFSDALTLEPSSLSDPLKNTASESLQSLSAFELMKKILENQKKEKVQSVEKHTANVKRRRCRSWLKRKQNSRQNTVEKSKEGEQCIQIIHTGADDCILSAGEGLLEKNRTDGACESAGSSSSSRRLNTDCDALRPSLDVCISPGPSNTQDPTIISDEDVDVVEISGSFTNCSSVLPLIKVTSEKEEDDESDENVDVISV